jgi:signal transduction histidine kinase
MTRIVEDLLTLARADDGQLQLSHAELDLGEVARAATAQLAARANEKQVRLLQTTSTCKVLGDRQRLQQAVANLIENAIEYSPTGGNVVVSTRQNGSEARLAVTDCGPGIPEQAQAHVFDRFYRVDPSRSRDSGGSGLGLAICYEIVRAHQGRIWVDSREGAGATFSIALPAAPHAEPRTAPSAPSQR